VLGRGRFGLVFRAQDPNGQEVVVRTFTAVAPESAAALADALAWLCEQPLDHPSVARPIASGLKGDVPYLVHAYLEGTPLDIWLDDAGSLSAADALPRLTQVAAALDFAAAVGVRHGLLSLRDVIVSPERSGVTGFGLAQALAMAFVPVSNETDDIRGLALIASVMLGRPVRGPVADVIASGLSHDAADMPGGALGFVARLKDANDAETAAAARAATIPAPAAADVEPPAVSSVRRAAVGAGFFAAVALAVGMLTGFAGGYMAGRREPAPPADRADVTGTRGYSEAPVESAPTVVDEPAVVAPEPLAPPSAPEPVAVPAPVPTPEPAREPAPVAAPRPRPEPLPARTPAPAPSGPGSLNVFSRPAGAQVYVDDRLIGTTPVSLSNVTPGAHTVRIALPGHQRWESHVTVTPGTATRVAASLEQ
jgi:hypothetical protein